MALSATSVSLTRGGTARVTLTATNDGAAPIDASLFATWTSSNPGAVTVAAGHLVAVGVGQARIDVTYQGASRSVDVVSRRNTIVKGEIVFTEINARAILDLTVLRMGDKVLGAGYSSSDHRGVQEVVVHVGEWAQIHADNATLPPGSYDMGVAFSTMWGRNGRVRLDGAKSTLALWDRDTNERLQSIPILTSEVVDVAVASDAELFRIPVTVPLFVK